MPKLFENIGFFVLLLIFQQVVNTKQNHPTMIPLNDGDETYCVKTLCEIFNGSHFIQMPHIACGNNGAFSSHCGASPYLLYMSERRQNLLLDMHNLARAKIASGKLDRYKSAAHMPIIKWDKELEYLATLHVKRCLFTHDQCRNTPKYPFSGQNIGYFWIGRQFKSHSLRMKSFINSWFREHLDANQSFIDNYHSHPEGKKIGHFTLLVADRVHRIGCAAIRFLETQLLSKETKYQLLLTCNYDFNNIFNEPVYHTGPTASQCTNKPSNKYPELCDWKESNDYNSENIDDDNHLENSITI